MSWYQIHNVERIDSPALLVYSQRVQENINLAKEMIGDVDRLRPHVKTHKMEKVCRMMLDSGITRFKCATIAEAEMLALAGAPDVLLAYQPTGPKIVRLLNLQKAYPNIRFSCLIDNEVSATQLSEVCKDYSITLNVYIDVNVGMNRTGLDPKDAKKICKKISAIQHIHVIGIHAYDGHIHDKDPEIRLWESTLSYSLSKQVVKKIQPFFPEPLKVIIGGTPTFPVHIQHKECECSPGTFVFWDWGYSQMIEELPAQFAALVLTRVISIIDEHHICVDLGYKAIASESPLPRVTFLNAPKAIPVAQSEEHLVLKVSNSKKYPIGMELYGLPLHICPTVALYDKAHIVTGNQFQEIWDIIGRKRTINY